MSQLQQRKTETLTAIFSEVLANLAFIFTDEESADFTTACQWYETVISYRGSTSGTLRFRCTREFSVLLASNLLGIDIQDEEAELKSEDAVKEFMNIVCGRFVTRMHGTDEVFNMSIPKISEIEEAPDLSRNDGVQVSMLSAAGHQVQLAYISTDNRSAQG